MILSKPFFFLTSKYSDISPQIIELKHWMTLKSSVVIFQALETSPDSLTSAASATSLALTASMAQTEV
jgi:hypothetical protein